MSTEPSTLNEIMRIGKADPALSGIFGQNPTLSAALEAVKDLRQKPKPTPEAITEVAEKLREYGAQIEMIARRIEALAQQVDLGGWDQAVQNPGLEAPIKGLTHKGSDTSGRDGGGLAAKRTVGIKKK